MSEQELRAYAVHLLQSGALNASKIRALLPFLLILLVSCACMGSFAFGYYASESRISDLRTEIFLIKKKQEALYPASRGR